MDHELSVRWTQYGVYAPVLRMHDKGEGAGPCAEQQGCGLIVPWDHPHYYFALIRDALVQRSELLPYVYAASYKFSKTGVPFVRPLYHEFDLPGAYEHRNTYFFGDDMVVAPAVTKADNITRLTNVATWIPPGEWWDTFSASLVDGPVNHSVQADLSETPRLIRGGAIVLTQPFDRRSPFGSAVAQPGTVQATIYPSRDHNLRADAILHEDDGLTWDPESLDHYTKFSYTKHERRSAITFNISIDADPMRRYPRDFKIVFVSSGPIAKIHWPGQPGQEHNGISVSYDPFEMAATILIEKKSAAAVLPIEMMVTTVHLDRTLLEKVPFVLRRARLAKTEQDIVGMNRNDMAGAKDYNDQMVLLNTFPVAIRKAFQRPITDIFHENDDEIDTAHPDGTKYTTLLVDFWELVHANSKALPEFCKTHGFRVNDRILALMAPFGLETSPAAALEQEVQGLIGTTHVDEIDHGSDIIFV